MIHEAQNMIPLGNLIMGYKGEDKFEWRDPVNWIMASVSDQNGIRLCALMTPPHGLTLYATNNEIDDEAILCLIDGLKSAEIAVSGLMTEKELALRFCKLLGVKYTITTELRLYELTEVNKNLPKIGRLRKSNESDMHFLPYWVEGFSSDAWNKAYEVPSELEKYLYSMKKFFIFEVDGTPVSMANSNKRLQTVFSIAGVYTPIYFRKKGYATACVAELCRLLLNDGFTKAVLYTDLSNPTSNKIYMEIGFREVIDSLELKFE